MPNNLIPQIEPWIDDNELFHLKRLIKSKYVVENDLTKEFETLVSKSTGSKYAISYTNGTMALYACLKSMGIGLGDEVIVPNLTFIATSNSVIMSGAIPVFCEVDEKSMCIDPSKIIPLITNKTKAIIPVHLYGNSAPLDEILNIGKLHNIPIIEDAAQGVGVKYKGKHVGTFGNCGILSYYGNKTITCGEGAIILTNDDDIAKNCYRLKNHGRDKKGVFEHEHIGFNFSFTEMQAAIGISQMEKLNLILNKKSLIRDNYIEHLTGVGDIKFQEFSDDVDPVHWFTSIFTEFREGLSEFLLNSGQDKDFIPVQTRKFFLPLHKQPCYKHYEYGEFPVSESLYERGLSLPSSYNLTEEQQMYIINRIKKFFENR